MKSSNIGGQAVLEGIMMRNGRRYSVGVRKPDGEIAVEVQEYRGMFHSKISKLPLIRGVFSFIDSLVLGMKSLTYSASFFDDGEEEQEMPEKDARKEEKKESMIMGLTIAFSVVLAVGIFMVLPYFLTSLLKKTVTNPNLFAICEGLIRIAIFFAYILLISRMKDIRRVFMYHGAEHKCINCIEHGLDLTVENVRNSSKEHKRCGTSFLLFVIMVSIVVHFFVRFDSGIVNILVRIALVPVIAGISFELIKWAGSSDNRFVMLLSKPGLLLQRLTTKEPDDSMIEVGIQAVEAVFDWRKFQEENPVPGEP